MKFNIDSAPPRILNPDYGVEVGNVYRNQRGQFYAIMSVFESRHGQQKASAFVLDQQGEILNVACYVCYYFGRLKLVGRAINIPDEIDVEWTE